MNTRIVILAAGKGTRMGADIPKPLLEVGGRPMIANLLESAKESGVDERPIIVIAPDAVEQFQPLCDGKTCDIAIQHEQLGTGHAVHCAEQAAGSAERILVLYGDCPFISPEKLTELVEIHTEKDTVMSMFTATVPNFNGKYNAFSGWAKILRNESGSVIRIREKKDANEDELQIKELNPGIYLFNADWLWQHLPEIKNKNASGEYYLTDLLHMAIEEGEDVATTAVKPFEAMGVNTPEELELARKLFG